MTKGHNTKCVYKGVVQNYGPVSLAASLSFWGHLKLISLPQGTIYTCIQSQTIFNRGHLVAMGVLLTSLPVVEFDCCRFNDNL